MGPIAAWFRSWQCSESYEAEIRSSLTTTGVRLEEDSIGPYGIICFERSEEQLFSILRIMRGDARARALVIAPPFTAQTPLIWRLLHAGAADVLVWSKDGSTAKQIQAKLERWFEVDALVADATSRASLVGDSPAWHAVVRKVVEAARFSDAPVLLIGESGTGKELLAKLISMVARDLDDDTRPFRRELVTVDCAALVPELSGSEFFGHERGAFTGAHSQREGAFALADGATLLLDEIGEVPLALQAQLLRAIQEKKYKRVGGNVWQSTNFRLVCATNRDLSDLVRQGRFRLDLYHRIAGCVFRAPPLTERRADILALATHFLRTALPRAKPLEFDDSVSEFLLNRNYSGNIRELRQLIDRIAHRHAGPGPVTAGAIPEEDRPTDCTLDRAWPDQFLERSIADALAVRVGLKEITQTAAEIAIRIAVQSEDGNLQRAARRLGITDRALQMRRAAARLDRPASSRAS